MRREYPARLRALLDVWDEENTSALVESKGVTLRNWRMFCLEAGVVNGRRWKQREIAAEYKLTIARVSKILGAVRRRLGGSVECYERLCPTREYRSVRRQVLQKSQIVNASFVNALTSMFKNNTLTSMFTKASWPKVSERLDYKEYFVEFIAKGKNWLKVSAGSVGRVIDWPREPEHLWLGSHKRYYSHKRVVCPGYTVFWLVVDVEGVGNQASRIVNDGHCIRDSYLIFDCEGSFWVMDKVEILRKEKRLVVHLKPAVVASVATAH